MFSHHALGNDSNVLVRTIFAAHNPKDPDNVPIKELKLIMRALGYEPRNAEVELIANKIKHEQINRGVNSHETMTIDEFLTVMQERLEEDKTKTMSEVKSAFRLFDRESKGYIDINDLKEAAKIIGEEVDDETLFEMIKEALGEDQSGHVDENAFFNIMKKTGLY